MYIGIDISRYRGKKRYISIYRVFVHFFTKEKRLNGEIESKKKNILYVYALNVINIVGYEEKLADDSSDDERKKPKYYMPYRPCLKNTVYVVYQYISVEYVRELSKFGN